MYIISQVIHELKGEISEKSTQIQALKDTVDAKNQQIDSITTEHNSLKQQENELKNKIGELDTCIAELRTSLSDRDKVVLESTDLIGVREEELVQLKTSLQEGVQRENELTQRSSVLNGQLEGLQGQ